MYDAKTSFLQCDGVYRRDDGRAKGEVLLSVCASIWCSHSFTSILDQHQLTVVAGATLHGGPSRVVQRLHYMVTVISGDIVWTLRFSSRSGSVCTRRISIVLYLLSFLAQ